MNEYIGLKLFNYEYEIAEIVGVHKTGNYLVKSGIYNGENGCYLLWDDKYIQRLQSKQEDIKQKKIKYEERLKQEQIREQIEAKEKAEQENLYGFDDNMSLMQKGRVLKILMKQYRYNGIVKTRKQFVFDLLEQNYYSEYKTFSNSMNSRARKEHTSEYCLCNRNDNTLYAVTKTEYDFFNYLKNNNISA